MGGDRTFSGFEKYLAKRGENSRKGRILARSLRVDLFTNIDRHIDLNVTTCKWTIKNRPPSVNHEDVCVEEIIESYIQSVEGDKFLYVSPRYQLLRRASIQSCIDIVTSNRSQSAATSISNQCLSWYQKKPLNFSLADKTPPVSEIEKVMMEAGGCYTFTKRAFRKTQKKSLLETVFIEIFKWESLEILNPNEKAVVELLLDAGLDELNERFTN